MKAGSADRWGQRDWLLLLPALALHVWVGLSALRPIPGDDGIYIASGRLLLEGVVPYRDYFLAHPPLRTLLAALVLFLTASPVAVKAVSLTFMAASGILLQRAIRHTAPPLVAAAGGTLFLLARTSLDSSGFFIGVDLALFFLVFGVERLAAGRPLAAGILHAFSLLAALHAAPAVAACAAVLCIQAGLGRLSGTAVVRASGASPGPLPAGRYLLGLLPAPLLFAALAVWPGRCFVDQVILYHLGKHAAMPGFGDPMDVVVSFLDRHKALLVLSLTGFLARKTPLIPLAASCMVLTLAVTSSFSSIHDFYYLMTLPFAAWMVAVGLGVLVQEGVRHGRKSALLALLPAFLLLVDLVPALRAGAQLDGGRSRGQALLESLSSTVTEQAPPGPILGDASLAPWIALSTGRRLSASEVDTNPKRFYSGATREEEFLRKIEQDPPAVVVVAPGHGLGSVPAVREWLRSRYPSRVTLENAAAESKIQVRTAP